MGLSILSVKHETMFYIKQTINESCVIEAGILVRHVFFFQLKKAVCQSQQSPDHSVKMYYHEELDKHKSRRAGRCWSLLPENELETSILAYTERFRDSDSHRHTYYTLWVQ